MTEKIDLVLVVEGEKDGLFQDIVASELDIQCEKVVFSKAEEALRRLSPQLVILNLNHQKERVKQILSDSLKEFPETQWVLSADEIAGEELVDFMRLGVADFLKQPVNKKDLQSLFERIENLRLRRSSFGPARDSHWLVSFFSSKGGVGVSFATVNVAMGLVQRNSDRVLLADFVLQHGNVAEFLDVAPQYTLLNVVENFERLDAKLLDNSLQKHRSGLFVLPCPKQPEESEFITAKETTDILKILKGAFHYTVVDMGHELNATSIACLDLSDLIFLVTTPDLPSLTNTKTALDMFKKLGYSEKKVRLILNRWHMKDEIETSVIEKNLGYPIFYKLIDDAPLALKSVNQGVPVRELSKNSELAKCFESLTDRVLIAAPKGH